MTMTTLNVEATHTVEAAHTVIHTVAVDDNNDDNN